MISWRHTISVRHLHDRNISLRLKISFPKKFYFDTPIFTINVILG
jgi:hypothetical protein